MGTSPLSVRRRVRVLVCCVSALVGPCPATTQAAAHLWDTARYKLREVQAVMEAKDPCASSSILRDTAFVSVECSAQYTGEGARARNGVGQRCRTTRRGRRSRNSVGEVHSLQCIFRRMVLLCIDFIHRLAPQARLMTEATVLPCIESRGGSVGGRAPPCATIGRRDANGAHGARHGAGARGDAADRVRSHSIVETTRRLPERASSAIPPRSSHHAVV